MARLQILELPTGHHGDDMVTPFVLVIDRAARMGQRGMR
jgi:tRNA(Ile)-lysidine synthase TilS/MesJ